MLRLMYISTARIAFTNADLGELLRVSRKNNDESGVTGLLIAGKRRFLQVLEGSDEAVQATFERIRRDKRHFATVVLQNAMVADRLFGPWAMGYQPLERDEAMPSVAANISALVGQICDPTVRAYFTGFAEQQAA